MSYLLLAPLLLGGHLFHYPQLVMTFYAFRSLLHGYPWKNGLRIAKYDHTRIVFPSSEDPFFDDVWLCQIYYLYLPAHDDVVLDIGAHMGFFSIKIAPHVKEVIAVEPDPVNYAFLTANIHYNRLMNVSAANLAMGDQKSVAILRRRQSYGSTQIAEPSHLSVHGRSPVSVTTIDDFVKTRQLSPKVITVHAEGNELKILQGARLALRRDHPLLLIASSHYQRETEDILAFIQHLGYTSYVYSPSHALRQSHDRFLYAIVH